MTHARFREARGLTQRFEENALFVVRIDAT